MMRVSLLALLVALPLSLADDKPQPPGKKAPAKSKGTVKAHEFVELVDQQKAIIDKLNSPISVDKAFDGVAMKDFLEFLGDRYDLTILVNPVGFKERGIERVEEQTLRVPKMPGVSLRGALEYGLNQVNATYLVVGNHLEITDKESAVRAVYGNLPESDRMRLRELQPRVNVIFDNVRLETALAELADQSGRNVVLDPRMTEAGKTTVSIRLLNTPIDTAVQLVARLHDFEVAAIDNSFVVTTGARVGYLKAKDAK